VDECFLYSTASITAAMQEHDKKNTPYLGRTITNQNFIHKKMNSRKLEPSATLLREPQISQIKTY
jgi:hypothetical protein